MAYSMPEWAMPLYSTSLVSEHKEWGIKEGDDEQEMLEPSTKRKLDNPAIEHKPRKKYKCEHGRQKSICKDCGGIGICEHKRIRSHCKDCGGSSMCEHGRYRSICKPCGGRALCKHGRQKSTCKECGGQGICEHGHLKYKCRLCIGVAICKHGCQKYQCIDCGGRGICEHRRRKTDCKQCNGSSICEHGSRKAICKLCGGSSICEHGRKKSRCKDCGGAYCCITCTNTTSKRGVQCGTCCPSTSKRSRKSEKRLEWLLNTWAEEEKIPKYYTYDKIIPGINSAACNARKPDFFYDMGSWILVVENDEHQHVREDGRCNLVRVQDIANAVGTLPMYFIRYNPDEFKVSGTKHRLPLEQRHAVLLHHIQEIIANPPTDNHITIRYLYYNCNQCTHPRTCSFVHTDTFKTMVEFGAYIESTYPLAGVGGPNSRPRPSTTAQHMTL